MIPMDFIRTNGKNKDFIENCRLLDMDLDRRVGKEIKRYNDETVELKRVFIHTEYQGRGIGSKLVSLLIEWSIELGYKRMILETGKLLVESCAVRRLYF